MQEEIAQKNDKIQQQNKMRRGNVKTKDLKDVIKKREIEGEASITVLPADTEQIMALKKSPKQYKPIREFEGPIGQRRPLTKSKDLQD